MSSIKPTLVIISGTKDALDFFSLNFMEKTKPFKTDTPTIIDYSLDWSLDSMFEVLTEQSSFSTNEYIYLNYAVDSVVEFETFSRRVQREYENHFKDIKFLFVNLDQEQKWSDEELEAIMMIAEDSGFTLSIEDLFDPKDFEEALNQQTDLSPTSMPQRDLMFEHISKSNMLIANLMDNLMFFNKNEPPEDLKKLANKNMSDLLHLTNLYIRKKTDGQEE